MCRVIYSNNRELVLDSNGNISQLYEQLKEIKQHYNYWSLEDKGQELEFRDKGYYSANDLIYSPNRKSVTSKQINNNLELSSLSERLLNKFRELGGTIRVSRNEQSFYNDGLVNIDLGEIQGIVELGYTEEQALEWILTHELVHGLVDENEYNDIYQKYESYANKYLNKKLTKREFIAEIMSNPNLLDELTKESFLGKVISFIKSQFGIESEKMELLRRFNYSITIAVKLNHNYDFFHGSEIILNSPTVKAEMANGTLGYEKTTDFVDKRIFGYKDREDFVKDQEEKIANGRDIVEIEGKNMNKTERIAYFRSTIEKFAAYGILAHKLLENMLNKKDWRNEVFILSGKDYTDELVDNLKHLPLNSKLGPQEYIFNRYRNYIISDKDHKDVVSKKLKSIARMISSPDLEDKNTLVRSEVAIKSDLLKLSGVIDLFQVFKDGTLGIIEFKTGNLQKLVEKNILNFGVSEGKDIYKNKINNAKLQALLRAVIIKAENPAALFSVIKIPGLNPNESLSYYEDTNAYVDAYDLLPIIESKIKEIYDDVTYKELVKRNVFNAKHYMQGYTNPIINHNMTMEDMLVEVAALENRQTQHANSFSSVNQKKLNDLRNDILTISKFDIQIKNARDITWLSKFLTTLSTNTHPAARLLYRVFTKQKDRVLIESLAFQQEYVRLRNIVFELYGINGVNSKFKSPEEFWKDKILVLNNSGAKPKYEFKKLEDLENKELRDLVRFIQSNLMKEMTYFSKDRAIRVDNGSKGTDSKYLSSIELRNSRSDLDTFIPYDSYYPAVYKSENEMARLVTGIGKKDLRYMYNKHLTAFNEINNEDKLQQYAPIPIRYTTMNVPDGYILDDLQSFDLDHVVTKSMNSLLVKKYFEPVNPLFNTIKTYASLNQLSRLNEWTEVQRKLLVQNLDDDLDKQSTRAFNFDISKATSQANSLIAGTILGFNGAGGTINGAFVSLFVTKEAIIGSATKFIGKNQIGNFTLKDLGVGIALAFKSFEDELHNKKTNKLNLLYQRTGFGAKYSVYNQSYKGIAKSKFFSLTSWMYSFYSLPEEIISKAVFAAQLHNLKHNGIPVYDLYSVNAEEQLEWNGGTRFEYNEFGEKLKATELTPNEIGKMLHVYEKMQGSYREHEKLFLDRTIWSKLILTLKRFIPTIISNNFASKSISEADGNFEEDVNGNMVWKGGVNEGRVPTLLRTIMYYTYIRPKLSDDTYFSRLLNFKDTENYKWENLSKRQQYNIIDTLVTFAIVGLLASSGGDDDRKETKEEVILRRIKQNFGQQVPFAGDMSKDLLQFYTPILFDILRKDIIIYSDYGYAYLTNDVATKGKDAGKIRGSTAASSTVPIQRGILKTRELLSETYGLRR